MKWIESKGYSLENIPFGVFISEGEKHCCTRIGDMVIDLAVLEGKGVFDTLRVNEDCGREGYLFI